jgi:hypothetical protein
MTKSVLLGAAALALTVTVASAAEDANSANYMMQGCRAFSGLKALPEDRVRQGWCAGVVNEISHVGIFIKTFLSPDPNKQKVDFIRTLLSPDIPAEVTLGQEIRVVVAYIDARPARMHEPFHELAFEALQVAWPWR